MKTEDEVRKRRDKAINFREDLKKKKYGYVHGNSKQWKDVITEVRLLTWVLEEFPGMKKFKRF